jgi:3-hydroxyisobutyrate dehydrogenase-like beta-hydroxyacid dehydrogenase
MRIGFVGLGGMGAAVAERLLGAGHEVLAWNRSPRPREAFARAGGAVTDRVEETLGGDVLFSMLADDEAMEGVFLSSGLLERARPGLVHAALATLSPAIAARFCAAHAARDGAYVAAPVLGRPEAAAAGRLNVLLAGPRAAQERLTPLLGAFAAAIWPLGEIPGRANVVKLACNFALASMIETLGEAGALAKAYGVGPETLFEIMTSTLFAAPAYRTYAPLVAAEAKPPTGFALKLGLKDVRLGLEAAEARALAMPLAALLKARFEEAVAAGEGAEDWSRLGARALGAPEGP